MRIDWFTFGAQILNFVVLVFLLKKLLYRPVLDAIAAREEHIRTRIEEADLMREDAEGEREAVRKEWADLESRRGALLEHAERDAEERREELADEVRLHAQRLREDWRASILRQRETFLEELRRRVEEETYALTERLLRDLADAELEERVIKVFLERVRGLSPEEREEFARALAESGGRIEVRSAFPVEPDHRRLVERLAEEWAGTDTEVRFQTDPELALGIEMRAGDRKVGWSAASYLADLRQDVGRHVDVAAG